MKILLNLVGSFIIWLLVTLILIAIVLIPREVSYKRVGSTDAATFTFSWDSYENNIKNYATQVWETKSFGISKIEVPVEQELVHYMKRSLSIIFPALFLSYLLGVLKGIYDYQHSRGIKNFIGNGSTWFMQSIPEFFFIITVQLGILYLIRQGFPYIDLYGYDKWYNVLLPIFFLSLYPLSYIARITSSAIAEQEGRDYIRTAHAKGISSRVILYVHILKNCWPKILSQFLTVMLTIISSSIIVEYLTFYRGAGKRLMDALQIKTIYSAGSHFPVEIPTIIGFSFGFMSLILVSLWIHQLLNYFLIPMKRGE
ncbi:ABC transporter permease subunit [Neobacillus sp. D3-1R]|uniref:ABC transporter permease subunit n=1 Tax=Neobacillus sp. D3-1R TaxID=3445778 RepID=UPI003FA0A491